MKKFLKIIGMILLGILILLIVVAMFSGGENSEEVSTGSENTTQTEESNDDSSRDDGSITIDASTKQATAQGLKIALGEIRIEEDSLVVGMNLENTTDGALSFYPDQGTAVIGDMQLEANLFFTEGDVSGDIQPGVKKEGTIEFLAPEGKTIDVQNVKEVKFIFGDVTTDDFMNSEEVNFTIPVK